MIPWSPLARGRLARPWGETTQRSESDVFGSTLYHEATEFLKLRAERMHNFADLGSVHEALAQLAARGLVQSLPRRPGQKEERYAQLLAGEPSDDAAPGGLAAAPAPGVGGDGLAERVARLEREVAELRAHVGI